MSALADFLAGSTEGVWCEQELREEVQALRAENERLTAELARQNAANDMIAAERDAYQTSRDEARLLFNKEYNEANESRRRLNQQIADLRAEVLDLSKRLLASVEDERKWYDRYFSLWTEACDRVDVSSRAVFGDWAEEVNSYYRDNTMAEERKA